MTTIEIILIIITAIALILSIISFYYTFKTKKRYENVIMRLGAGEDLTKIMDMYISKVEKVSEKNKVLEEYITRVDQELGKSIKKVGLVKYDAFNNTKNKLSFALALLDRNNNGIVINNIYGIEDSNAYAKPIEKGKSKYNLSAEEEDAIKKAMQK